MPAPKSGNAASGKEIPADLAQLVETLASASPGCPKKGP